MAFIRRSLVAALGCGLFLSLSAPAALAHDSLKSSSPAKDARVARVDRIELEYSARVRFPAVVLHDAAGKPVSIGPPQATGPKVTAEVPAPLAPGGYVIAWRVVSSDGHPIEGEIPFTVTGGSAASPASAAPTAQQQQEGADGVPGWLWAAGAALVLVAAAVWLLGRRGSRTEEE
ncbi:copper resistance protein CopC [Nonomuraea sp. NPDC000554]|uniref:copper resistance CopC family protein n=1 Tax=Nonomuraea sp. NPDC000554 TaxID=3154259 RepID=UPI0033305D34